EQRSGQESFSHNDGDGITLICARPPQVPTVLVVAMRLRARAWAGGSRNMAEIFACDLNHKSRCNRSQVKRGASGKLDHHMNDFGVLNSRKRAIIALIHSFVFLGVAMHGFLAPKHGILRAAGGSGDYVLIGIYLVVASILSWMVRISRCA